MSIAKRMLSRRNFLRASMAVTGLAVAACAAPGAAPGTAPGDESSAPAGEGTNITYWTFWADRWGEFQQQIVDQYNAENQDGIQVEMLIVPWGELATKLLTAVSAGNPPDFSIVGRGEVVEWAARGGVMQLDDYIAASDRVKPEDWFEVAWGECLWQGKTYAQPFESGTYAAWFHKEMFEEAGLDPNTPPVTWDDVDAAAEQITKGSATDGYTALGFIPWSNRVDLLGWLAGGEWYDEEAQQVTATTPENIAAFEWVKQYADKYGGEALERFRQGLGGGDTADDPFYRNQIAMVWKGSWSLSAKQEYAPDLAFGVHPLPYRGDAGNDSINQGSACVLPTGSPQPDPAYKFLTYMSIDGIAQWVPNAADMVSRKDQTDIYPNALPDNEEFRGYWQLYNEALAYSHHEPAMPARRFWSDQLTAAVEAVVRGQKTPEQALQDAQDATQRELDKALGKA
jgi:multiple sugar transport system substrate-binding protein